MTEILDALFIIQFLVVITVILMKLYNVMYLGDKFPIEQSFMQLIVLFLSYGVGLSIVLVDVGETLLYTVLFQLEAWLFVLIVFLFFSEIVMFIKGLLLKPAERYKPKRDD